MSYHKTNVYKRSQLLTFDHMNVKVMLLSLFIGKIMKVKFCILFVMYLFFFTDLRRKFVIFPDLQDFIFKTWVFEVSFLSLEGCQTFS